MEEEKKKFQSRFQKHLRILLWKSYLQRQRRWQLLALETLFAAVLYGVAVYIAWPVFLTPVEAEPEPPLTSNDIFMSLNRNNIVGYAPNDFPYVEIMARAAQLLKISISGAQTEKDLNNLLYQMANTSVDPIRSPVIWILWQPKVANQWRFSIRSTERAKYETGNRPDSSRSSYPNPHLRAGFLAVQLAVSQAIVEHASIAPPDYELNLVSMPVSPLMEKHRVRRALSCILLCFTLSFIPTVLDTEVLVMSETTSMFKRSLRVRGVGYGSMYLGWLFYAYLTTLPTCFLASITLILIFRWIDLLSTLVIILAYVTMLIMMALMMAMYHEKPWLACVWSTLFTLLTTYLAELIVHHEYDASYIALTVLLHVLLPPLGLIHALNNFALLQTGQGVTSNSSEYALVYLVGIWCLRTSAYFGLLMLLQYTISNGRAIGGQISWKTIIFKQEENKNKLRRIETPTGRERDKLQEVDDMVAKAVSLRNVSKNIMGVPLLSNITMDIYRGEYTLLFAERVQEKMMNAVDDLLSGLTYPDKGSIYILGHKQESSRNYMTELHMIGYCHRDPFLVPDLTVEEHFTFFTEICLWQHTRDFIDEYGHMRTKYLLKTCDLLAVRHVKASNLDSYYRAQLCWAIAVLLEPKVIILSHFSDLNPRYVNVIRHKIMTHKNYLTMIKCCFTSLELEFADRVFVFDTRMLAFGGTPAYMYFKFGREYRVRITIRSEASDEARAALIARAAAAGATVRAHLGLLLILRLPANPTENVAELVQDMMSEKVQEYGITSINISVPDPEEVSRRAITELRSEIYGTPMTAVSNQTCVMKDALKRYSEPLKWRRKATRITCSHLKIMGWKYFSFHMQHKLYFTIMLLAAFVTGVLIGISLAAPSSRDDASNTLLLHGVTLTMENFNQKTVLVLRSDNSTVARSMSHAYILSEPNATQKNTGHITCNALSNTQSLTEYLVTRAIDSPQLYVYMYAYGMDVKTRRRENGDTYMMVNTLYSPIHYDYGAAARSLAKVYSTILRHYTSQFDSSIQVTDYPLTVDLSPMGLQSRPPLLIQFLLIIVISHATYIPSMEYGLVRHMQKHAMNFSPVSYWMIHYFLDLILYWIVVALITGVVALILFLSAIDIKFDYSDLLVVPFMMIIYGVAVVPQAYLFSLGPRVALNAMTFIIVNLVFGEATIVAKLFYGDIRELVLFLMNISPQFNMAYAFVKIKQIFNYNSECFFFEAQNLCATRSLHKCCEQCGVLQECFVKKKYLTSQPGVLRETMAMLVIGFVFTIILLLLEYKLIQKFFKRLISTLIFTESPKVDELTEGAQREKKNVEEKVKQIKNGSDNTFGEYLLAQNLTYENLGMYAIHNVNLGVGKGQAIAISGLKRHGRLRLVEMLAGFNTPSHGQMWTMSQWNYESNPHKYAREVALSCERSPLPPWMTVYDALEMLGILRGVPKKHLRAELTDLIEALEFEKHANMLIKRIKLKKDRLRLHFAAAVVGAPPVVVLDECTASQKYSVRRAMYFILHTLRKRGHAVVVSSSNVESHMPITNRLAILVDGTVYDVDSVDNLVGRYSNTGYTIVVHLKDDVDILAMFSKHFKKFTINDTSEVLVNVQVLDPDLNWSAIFQKMESLKKLNQQVYSYIITVIPMDYIYNSIINNEKGNRKIISGFRFKMFEPSVRDKKIKPSPETLKALIPFERKYEITKLKELPCFPVIGTVSPQSVQRFLGERVPMEAKVLDRTSYKSPIRPEDIQRVLLRLSVV